MRRSTPRLLSSSPNICIVGGGAIGLSSALHLLQSSPSPSITLVERDSTYRVNSAVLSAGGVRSQFSLKENVECSLYGLEVFKKNGLNDLLKKANPSASPVDLQFMNGGYLFLSSTLSGSSCLTKNLKLQKSLGAANTELLHGEEVGREFPYLNTEDLRMGCYSKDDGWFDPYSFLTGVREGIKPRIREGKKLTEIETENNKITRMKIDGEWQAFDFVVNATGANANSVIDKIPNIRRLPVEARKRTIFHFKCKDVPHPDPTSHIPPLTVDPSGVWYRSTSALTSESSGDFICGCTPTEDDEQDAERHTDDIDPDYSLWEEVIWPKLYERCEAFGGAKVLNQWAGWYEYNVKDQNGIVGFHPDCSNLILANGFSGHGLQQSPAVGRAVSELVEDGKFRTIDLDRFKFERFEEEGGLIFEEGIV
ncbi:hypothetical protein TrVE_jg13482 [Triparma verrucosa]|uniref:FAD-dependent oxidoreductase domain-containing protein 1 n=1 Tax=Triparma verrucosa TaxID=1606542 RepID=A0A9W7B9Z4_9STRA|nr:hypothetical protein TrVE_jg13482 [Triparma verrucosa]